MTDEQCRTAQRNGVEALNRPNNACSGALDRQRATDLLYSNRFCDDQREMKVTSRSVEIKTRLPDDLVAKDIVPLHPGRSPRLVLGDHDPVPVVPPHATDLEVHIPGSGRLATAQTLATRIHGQLGNVLKQMTLTIPDRDRMRNFLNGITPAFLRVSVLQLTEAIDHDNLPILMQKFPRVNQLYLTTVRVQNHVQIQFSRDSHAHLRTLQVSAGVARESEGEIQETLKLVRNMVRRAQRVTALTLKLRLPDIKWIPYELRVKELVFTGSRCMPSMRTAPRRRAFNM